MDHLTDIKIPKKRGRKSKKELEAALNNSNNENTIVTMNNKDNINVFIEENVHLLNSSSVDSYLNIDVNNEVNIDENTMVDDNSISKPALKKRGRKPKGGKIVQHVVQFSSIKEIKPNVILHLKCSLKDLQTNPLINSDFDSFNFLNKNQLSYENISFVNNNETITENKNSEQNYDYEDEDEEFDEKIKKNNDIREVWKKLKILEHNLHINNICDKKSACFWCTCDFDNPPVYIPKFFIKESYHVYGCFCSPECATAHLMEENIDSSIKFERYHLLNHVYSKIYDYTKNIKPAPNPYYILDKFFGNLNIQEYRSLLRNERLFLVVDKPLTRMLPELHEDNDDFIINNKIIPSNTYQFKKKLQKKQNKTNILSERFGVNQN
jgi:hypothetical protein